MKKKNNILIRSLQKEDIEILSKTFLFPWATADTTIKKWKYYQDQQQKGIRAVFLLERQRELLGYASLLFQSHNRLFRENNIPEIHDLWIQEKWRHQGFGTLLIEHLEEISRQKGYSHIGIGVGLYQDYGSAQKLYVQLGYIPTGQGATYQSTPVKPGTNYPMDDDLVLWLSKSLLP